MVFIIGSHIMNTIYIAVFKCTETRKTYASKEKIESQNFLLQTINKEKKEKKMR